MQGGTTWNIVKTVWLVAIIIGMIVLYSGPNRRNLTPVPITDLEEGKAYKVIGIIRGEESYHLTFDIDNGIEYCQLSSNEVPSDLKVGDKLLKLSTGELEILPKG